ncbi:MAG: lysophospholipid acyltransferase family protein [Planctomycetota bacterium]
MTSGRGSQPDERTAPGTLLRWIGDCSYQGVRLALRVLFLLAFRLRVEGDPPESGPCVLAPNHGSFLDPLLLGVAARRRVVFLMTEILFRSPWLRWFYRWARVIPVAARGANRDALRRARETLRRGQAIGIFPEGGLSRDGGFLLGNPGAVALVLQEGAPIVPVGILGSREAMPAGRLFPRFSKIIVRFGEPILPSDIERLGAGRKQRLAAATRLIMDRIAELTGGESREAELDRLRRC